jgi:GMP synthase-like glutamine amidotransferase
MLAAAGLILQHEDEGPAARFADWLVARGLPFEVHRAGEGPLPDPREFSFVATLGSERSAAETDGWVPEEIAMLRQAIAAEVPVLGMCFGGQALSVALGGGVEVMDVPEVGWVELEILDAAIPQGRWLQYHHDRIELPPGARELARSPAGPAAFECGRHLGLQFHPEADGEIADVWARADPRLHEAGVTVQELAEQSAEFSAPALDQAYRLFDRWHETVLDGRLRSQGQVRGARSARR